MSKIDKNLDDINLYELILIAKQDFKLLVSIPILFFIIITLYLNFIKPSYKLHTEVIGINMEAMNQIDDIKLMRVDMDKDIDFEFIIVDTPNKGDHSTRTPIFVANEFENISPTLDLDVLLVQLRSDQNFANFIGYDSLNKYANLNKEIIYEINNHNIDSEDEAELYLAKLFLENKNLSLHTNLINTDKLIYKNFLAEYLNYTIDIYIEKEISSARNNYIKTNKKLNDLRESYVLKIDNRSDYTFSALQIKISQIDFKIELCRKYIEKCVLGGDGEIFFTDIISENNFYESPVNNKKLTLEWLIDQRVYLQEQNTIENIQKLNLEKFKNVLLKIDNALEYNMEIDNKLNEIDLKEIIFFDKAKHEYIHNLALTKYSKEVSIYTNIIIALLISFIATITTFLASLFYKGYKKYTLSISKS